MLFYHIISGVLPFWDDQSSVVIKTKVSKGERPDLKYQGYELLPHFLHLENLMESCWNKSPSKRPKAVKALETIKDASFYCLRQTLNISRDEQACLYAKQTKQEKDDQVKFTWYSKLWQCLGKIHFRPKTADVTIGEVGSHVTHLRY